MCLDVLRCPSDYPLAINKFLRAQLGTETCDRCHVRKVIFLLISQASDTDLLAAVAPVLRPKHQLFLLAVEIAFRQTTLSARATAAAQREAITPRRWLTRKLAQCRDYLGGGIGLAEEPGIVRQFRLLTEVAGNNHQPDRRPPIAHGRREP